VTEEATGQAHRRTGQMLADPELGGDLLLVGLALAGLLDLDAPRVGERVRLGDVAKLAWPRSPGTRYIVRRVLASDARTYRAPEPSFGEDRCTAPMNRPGFARGWGSGHLAPLGDGVSIHDFTFNRCQVVD
jgi:hypothetical protein